MRNIVREFQSFSKPRNFYLSGLPFRDSLGTEMKMNKGGKSEEKS
jgi:hypothetical protein